MKQTASFLKGLWLAPRAALHAGEASMQAFVQTPGLVAIWSFGEESGEFCKSVGTKET